MDVDVVAANDADPATNATLVASITATAIPSTSSYIRGVPAGIFATVSGFFGPKSGFTGSGSGLLASGQTK